jgi:hypothetical protein
LSTPVFDCALHGWQFKIHLSDNIGCADADLLGRQHTILDESCDRHLADAQAARGLVQNHFTAFRTLSVAINRDGMVIAESSHALLRPRVTLCGPYTKPVENGCDVAVRQQARQVAN